MSMTIMTSRELDRDATRARKAAESGPVIITDRGKPTHALLSIAEYRRLTGQHRSLAEALSMPGLAGSDFDPPHARIKAAIPNLS